MSNAFPLIPSENRGVLCTCFWVFFEWVCAAAGGLSGTEPALLFLSASSSFQSSLMCHCTSAHPFPLLRSVLWLLFLCACGSHVSHYFPGISTMLCFHYSLFLFFAFFSFYMSHLLLSISIPSSELMSMVNMSSSAEYSPPSSLHKLPARTFLLLFLLFFAPPASPLLPVEPKVCMVWPTELFLPIRDEVFSITPSDRMGEVAR